MGEWRMVVVGAGVCFSELTERHVGQLLQGRAADPLRGGRGVGQPPCNWTWVVCPLPQKHCGFNTMNLSLFGSGGNPSMMSGITSALRPRGHVRVHVYRLLQYEVNNNCTPIHEYLYVLPAVVILCIINYYYFINMLLL